MADKWRPSTWGEEISLEYGKSLKGYRESDGNIQVFGSNGAVGWTTKALSDGPGVILGRKGAYRGVRYSKDPFFVIDTAYYVKPKTDLDMQWLYYSIIHHKLGEIDDGSPIPSTTRAAVYVADVDIPPFPEQKAIAHILGSLDDKIALAAGNPIPDELAPRAEVRKKALANGTTQQGSLDHPTLSDPNSLFPAAFSESSFGFVPKGYTSETIDDLCSFVSRGVTPKYEEGSGRFIINQKVNRGTELDLSNLKELQPDLAVPEGKHALKYDVLVNCLGEGTLGRVHFYGGESGLYAVDQHMTICRAKRPELAVYIYHYLASPEGQDRIEASKTGSTGMTMFNIKKVRAFDVPIPTDECVKAFGKEVLDLSQKIEANRRQSVILTKLRDTLLPKLISGELRISEAEQLTKQAST